MKVLTNLKSGNLIEDAQHTASVLGDQFGGFFQAADQQAETVTSTISNKMKNVWQSLTDSIRQR
jgi:hypothetical protein